MHTLSVNKIAAEINRLCGKMDLSIYMIRDPRCIAIMVGQTELEILIDSGAAVNTISEKAFKVIQRQSESSIIEKQSIKDDTSICGYGNNKLELLCTFQAHMTIKDNGKTAFTTIFVVQGVDVNLLSYHTSVELGVLRLGLNINRVEEKARIFPKIPMAPAIIKIDETIPCRQIIRYNVPKAFELPVKDRLHAMEQQGIVERVNELSEISSVSPIMVVPKGEKDFRLVTDFREVNKRIIRVPHPLPRLETIWTNVPVDDKKQLFMSVLDLKDAFFHIELDEKVRHITTFMSAEGLMRYCRLPFGISIAPELFQRTMEAVLAGLQNVIIYLDDVLIMATSIEELEKRTTEVKERLKTNNLTINENKSRYNQTEVDFLGFKINAKGIGPKEQRINDICKFKAPTKKKELDSFIGMMTYIGTFIKSFDEKMHRLREAAKEKVLEWNDLLQKDFEILKENARKHIVQKGYFNEKDSIILYTDASPFGLGAILVQKARDEPERIIGCASKTLTAAEKNYPQLHREALSIIWGMERFVYYLLGRKFTLRTDNEALSFILNRKSAKADAGKRVLTRAEGWFLRMEYFDFECEHVKGTGNIADSPSRMIDRQAAPEAYEVFKPIRICNVKEDFSTFSAAAIKEVFGINVEEFARIAENDREYALIKSQLMSNNMGGKSMRLQRQKLVEEGLAVQDGMLLRRAKVVVPKGLKETALAWGHRGHADVAATKRVLRDMFSWLKLGEDVEARIAQCQTCMAISKMDTEQQKICLISTEENKCLTELEVLEAAAKDEQLQKVIEWIERNEGNENWPQEIEKFKPHRQKLKVKGKILYRQNQKFEDCGKFLIVVPQKLTRKALRAAHVGHPGIGTMKRYLRRTLWWPGVTSDITEYVRTCKSCQLITDTSRPEPIRQTELPSCPWDFVSMDFCTASEKDNWKALVLVDHYSRFCVAEPMTKTTAEDVIKVLSRIFKAYYTPSVLQADNGPPFNAKELKEWLEGRSIELRNTTPLNPTENGMVERKMRGINKAAIIAKLEKRPWKETLEEYVSLYNVWPHAMTGIPPAELMFGRTVRGTLPCKAIMAREHDDGSLRDRDDEQKCKRNEREDVKRKATAKLDFNVGDKVLVKQARTSKTDTTYKNSIFEIIKVGKGGDMTLKELSTEKIIMRNVKMLKKYCEADEMQEPDCEASEKDIPSQEERQTETLIEEGVQESEQEKTYASGMREHRKRSVEPLETRRSSRIKQSTRKDDFSYQRNIQTSSHSQQEDDEDSSS